MDCFLIVYINTMVTFKHFHYVSFDADLSFVWQTEQIMSPSYGCGQVQRLRLSTKLSLRDLSWNTGGLARRVQASCCYRDPKYNGFNNTETDVLLF